MSVRETRGRLAVARAGLKRMVMWHMLSGRLPLYLVTEFPKSGGSWFGQMLARYLDVPFPRNVTPPLASCVMHGHHLWSRHFRNVFCVVRDGRDVMVSAYYHLLFSHERNPSWSVRYHRRRVPFVDYHNVVENMPAFIEYMFEVEGQRFNRFRWDEFMESYRGRANVGIVRYEDMLQDAASEVGRAVEEVLGVPPDMDRLKKVEGEFSFERQSGRKPGQEGKSFLRKGVAGDWKNKFTLEACEVFDFYAGECLVASGYEAGPGWIEEQGRRFSVDELNE